MSLSKNAEALRRYKSDLTGKNCDCGKPAVKYARGSWGCATCIAIEDFREAEERSMSQQMKDTSYATINRDN
jgi:hypothetical protein